MFLVDFMQTNRRALPDTRFTDCHTGLFDYACDGKMLLQFTANMYVKIKSRAHIHARLPKDFVIEALGYCSPLEKCWL